jgi:hypothetical protein
MVAVVLSGIVGRFIYIQIPRTIQGHELSFEELRNLNNSLSSNLKESFHLEESFLLELDEFAAPVKDKIKSGGSLFLLVEEYFKNKRFLRSVKKYLIEKKISKKDFKEIVKICKSKLVLSRRIEMLRSMQKLFKYWHIVHLPFAILMLLIMIVHVTVTIIFGYKWIF